MTANATNNREADDEDTDQLSLPEVRCLGRDQAAAYLGIKVTLLTELGVPFVKLGRRCVYDRVDLDTWLDEYKHRGRARREIIWPVKAVSTNGGTPASGGSTLCYRTADAYAKALGLKTEPKPKRSSSS
jgi:hypothetical protein